MEAYQTTGLVKCMHPLGRAPCNTSQSWLDVSRCSFCQVGLGQDRRYREICVYFW